MKRRPMAKQVNSASSPSKKLRLELKGKDTVNLNVQRASREVVDKVKWLAISWNSTFEYAINEVLMAGVKSFFSL
jgi:hypothetical protein